MDFVTATQKAKSFTKTPPDNVFLEFYGLYKQATVGDCNVAQPGALDLKGKAKWNAWNGNKGMSQDAAKAAYVAAYEKYAPQYA
ncbi:acyl-CoA-binding protein-like [Musca domestica]|uniref:Acyl-CoA-binding protein-like n=1 Tax=Musca domestica TaxID=7370 RepID=A0A1I8NHY8_MUSDO|nr:acyl-CoA-binding protein-like [Musca domestica]